MQLKPTRVPWDSAFPPVLIHTPRFEVITHPWFAAARSGDVDAAALLVADTLAGPVVDRLAELGQGDAPLLAAVHAYKLGGLNVLPEVLAHALHLLLGWELDTELVQANIVDHAGDVGYARLACQAVFDGGVAAGRRYVLVDDFIGQGGTIANLRGHIVHHGGRVVAATVLTGNMASAPLQPDPDLLQELRGKHGSIERWWKDWFGFGFDCLTRVEAGYLASHRDPAHIRAGIAAAGCA
jgi:hypothetical protein